MELAKEMLYIKHVPISAMAARRKSTKSVITRYSQEKSSKKSPKTSMALEIVSQNISSSKLNSSNRVSQGRE